jgi:ribonuclease G
VWLKSGGYLIVDEMEALTAIDVNTGRFVGRKNLEDTITQTNLEACREVAEQLRIRSLGGMIVVDFIDMDRASNRERVTRAFNDHLRRDRSKAVVTRISELGLVEMTRKRTRESLLHALTEPCEHCEGKGYTKSRRTVAYELLRELRRQGNLIDGDTVLIEVHPDVAQVLATTDHGYLEDMEKRLQKRIIVKARGSFALEDFELRSPTQKTPLDRSDADREGERADRRRRRRKKLGPPAEVEAMLEEEERGSADNREVIGADHTPEPVVDGRAAERPGADAEAATGDFLPDPSDARRQPGTAAVPAGAESPQAAAPVSASTPASSETQQGASETTAVPAATDAPKAQG